MCFVVKYLLWGFNVLCAIIGIIVIVIGVIAHINGKSVSSILEGQVTLISASFIIIGVVIFVISAIGCYGAIQESSCLLKLYALTLIIILLLQITLGILTFAYRSRIKENAKTELQKEFGEYAQHKLVLDELQKDNECCGFKGKSEFKQIPSSCCGVLDTVDAPLNDCTLDRAYGASCEDKVDGIIHEQLSKIGFTAFCVSIVEVICIVLACCLAMNGD